MELYLDSVDFKEIEEAVQLGIIAGLTTTPTFMHRQGITNIDEAIVKLSKMVSVLQIEALGDTYEEIQKEVDRLMALGLDKSKTVFKIPVSNVGIQACKKLRDKGFQVNIHLVYTLNQAYMAMQAGATYVCPLVGRLQDQGHDALQLVEQCVEMASHYGYKTKVMFSSVRHAEHVRNAIISGVHTITAPWSVIRKLTENNFTTVGTEQFIEHTKLITIKVKDALSPVNPVCSPTDTLLDALVKMTNSKLGAISVVDKAGNLKGVFTDGDIRRHLEESGKAIMDKKMGDFSYKSPVTINADAYLGEVIKLFKEKRVDNILVLENNLPIGFIDIQDMVKMGLVG